MPFPRARARLVPALLVLALVAAGCSAAGAADREGVVTVLGQLGGPDQAALEQVLAAFSTETGVAVEYESVGDVGRELDRRRAAAEDNAAPGAPSDDVDPLPDVVLFPGPALGGLVDAAHLRRLDGVVDDLESSLVPVLRGQGTRGAQRWAVPLRVTLNSLVWYRPDVFEERGYEVPATHEELLALLDRIEADDLAPWCAGIESAQETGWLLTDWIEDLLLRTAGPEAYQAWIDRELPFDSPEVTRAAQLFEQLVLEEGRVRGGRLALLTTPHDAAPVPAFQEPPLCVLHRQGTLAGNLYGGIPEREDIEVGEDVTVFAFPPVDPRWGLPLTGNVELAALVSAEPGAERLIRHLATPTAGARWMGAEQDSPLLSPHAGFDATRYPDDAQREQARILAEATSFSPDASQSMPEWLGGYAFHWELIDWISSRQDLATALRDIEGARPPLIDRPDAFPTDPPVQG